ncbi:MAG: galactofuranosyltransferase, partial [Tannerella sp.]|nr:galactofuranosyltransferase [Tannerella sp.]
SSCTGNCGEYLRINNPHKVSLYIRCHCPVIIWEEAAMAAFVTENKIGICIRSLEELDAVLSSISPELYNEMVENVKRIDGKISSGYYFSKALEEARKCL